MKSAGIIIIIGVLVMGFILLARGGGEETPIDNVKVVDGVQIIEIRAKGGYRPKRSLAQAGIPTILLMSTEGTFDCSLALRIPSRGVSLTLPGTGSTDIDLGKPEAGTLQGLCSMGMYRFAVEFEN